MSPQKSMKRTAPPFSSTCAVRRRRKEGRRWLRDGAPKKQLRSRRVPRLVSATAGRSAAVAVRRSSHDGLLSAEEIALQFQYRRDGATARRALLSPDKRRPVPPAPRLDPRRHATDPTASEPSAVCVDCFLPQHPPLCGAFAGSSGLLCRVDRRPQTLRFFRPAQTDHSQLGVVITYLTMHHSAVPFTFNDHVGGRVFRLWRAAPFAPVPSLH